MITTTHLPTSLILRQKFNIRTSFQADKADLAYGGCGCGRGRTVFAMKAVANLKRVSWLGAPEGGKRETYSLIAQVEEIGCSLVSEEGGEHRHLDRSLGADLMLV